MGLKSWAIFLATSALAAAVLHLIRMPGALLLGPMVAGIITSLRGERPDIPSCAMPAALAVIGCYVAKGIDLGALVTFSGHWAVYLAATGVTLLSSSLLGYAMSRWQVLPGTAAVWGTTPGASAVMTLMAEEAGADAQLVAFMQYFRTVIVIVSAALLGLFLQMNGGGHHPVSPQPKLLSAWPTIWFPVTIMLATAGVVIGRWLRLPSGVLMGPLILCAVLNVAGLVEIELPAWVLAVSYIVIGWKIGLGFTAESLRHVARLFPRVLLSIILLILMCGGSAALLIWGAGIDPVTAYLATSPGGLDSIAIIANASPVDVPVVVTLQLTRFVAVMFLAPALAGIVHRHVNARAATRNALAD